MRGGLPRNYFWMYDFYRFMRGVKVGEDIVIESSLLKQGKSLAFLMVDIKRKEDDKLIAQGRHTKHIGS